MLHQGKHNLAAPAALQALKTSVELFGNGSVDTTPAYFALAEANIGKSNMGVLTNSMVCTY